MEWHLVLIGLYLMPTLIALARRQRVMRVLALNVLLGWTLVAWVVALGLALWPARGKTEYVEVDYDGTTYEDLIDGQTETGTVARRSRKVMRHG